MNNKAFTLMELMVVILIIAILAAIAFPVYNSAIENQNNLRAKALMETINGGMKRFRIEYPESKIEGSGAYVRIPASTVTCDYHGQLMNSATDFVDQMIVCGYIPRSNYSLTGNATGSGFLDYQFVIQDPESAGAIGYGYVYMEPKAGAKVGKKYCRPDSNDICKYKAAIGSNDQAQDYIVQ